MTSLRLAQYEILEPIGRGGMGIVYRARDRQLGRIVAIKVLPASFSLHLDRRSRFLREAQAAANLNHPNIAMVHQFGSAEVDDPDLIGDEADGPSEVLFLVMEYVAGEDLNAKLDRGALPLGEALSYGLQIASGLEAAHRVGVVHRDLKPNNVRITPDGQVKILDFGLAKVLGPALSETAEGSFETTQGMVMGTPPFMAPEQLRGTEVDARSDLYSLGIVLYQMISGRLPFPAKNLLEYAKALVRGEPTALRQWHPEVTPEQAELIHSLMAQEAEARPQSATEVIETLERCGGFERTRRAAAAAGDAEPQTGGHRTSVTQAMPFSAPASGPTSTNGDSTAREPAPAPRRLPLAAFLVLLLAGAGLLWWFTRHPPPNHIGVTPFANTSGDDALDLLAESLPARIVSELNRMPQIQVISPSVIRPFFPLGERGLRELGREVGAGCILTGSVQSSSRIYVELTESRRGLVIWNGDFPIPSHALDQVEFGAPELDMIELIKLAVEVWLDLAKPLKASDFYRQGQETLGGTDPQQDADKASALFEEAVRIDGKHAPALAGLSSTYLHEYDFRRDRRAPELLAAAEKYALEALRIDETNENARIALARIQRRQGDLAGATRLLEEVVAENPSSDRGYFELGATHRKKRDFAKATTSLSRAVELKGEYWFYRDQLGLLLMEQGETAAAEQQLSKAVELSRGLAWARVNLGALYLRIQRFDEAKEVLEQIPARQLDVDSASNLGTLYYFLGEMDKARDYFQRAIQLKPTEAGLHRNLGDALTHLDAEAARNSYRDAYENLEGCDRSPPRDDLVRCAEYAALAERCDDARRHLDELGSRLGDSAAGAYLLAQAGARCGSDDEAVRWIRRAIKLGKSSESFRSAPEFRGLLGTPAFEQAMGGIKD